MAPMPIISLYTHTSTKKNCSSFFFVCNFRINPSHCPKTPLIVVSLCIAPDTKTLAPSIIKRDPRKQPPFCQYFKIPSNHHSDEKPQTYPEFLIRGIEITEKSKNSSNFIDETETHPDIGLFEPIELANLDDCTCCEQQKELLLNLDGYEMDNFGHLPGDSRTPTPMRGAMFRNNCLPSPATEQVIRVTMNNKCFGNSNMSKRKNFSRIAGNGCDNNKT